MATNKKAGATAIASPDALDIIENLNKKDRALFEALRERLTTAKTLADLNATVDDNFRTDVSVLPEDARRVLRDQFSVTRDEVKHKVKMEQIADKVLVIPDPPDFPNPSPDFPDSVFCVIKGKVEESGETFECVSGAKRVVGHFQGSKRDSYPQRVEFYRESEDSMKARNAKPGTTAMWLVRRMAPVSDRRKDGVPF